MSCFCLLFGFQYLTVVTVTVEETVQVDLEHLIERLDRRLIKT